MIRVTSWWLIKRLIKLKFPEVKQLSTVELATWLADKGSKPVLLDARTPEEYQVSHLNNAKLVTDNLQDIVANVDYTTPIVAYCSVGYRSSAIARRLEALGYQNVFNLEGSIFEWINENRPVYRQGKQTTKVHPYQKFWKHLLIDS